jgi:hypothetical protein
MQDPLAAFDDLGLDVGHRRADGRDREADQAVQLGAEVSELRDERHVPVAEVHDEKI